MTTKLPALEYTRLKPNKTFLHAGDYDGEHSSKARGMKLLEKNVTDVLIYIHGAGGKEVHSVYYKLKKGGNNHESNRAS